MLAQVDAEEVVPPRPFVRPVGHVGQPCANHVMGGVGFFWREVADEALQHAQRQADAVAAVLRDVHVAVVDARADDHGVGGVGVGGVDRLAIRAAAVVLVGLRVVVEGKRVRAPLLWGT